jgi:hypothetical protein
LKDHNTEEAKSATLKAIFVDKVMKVNDETYSEAFTNTIIVGDSDEELSHKLRFQWKAASGRQL